LGQNNDPAKAKGSAETYAVKYFLTKLFLIPVKDEGDPDYGKKDDGSEPKENEEDKPTDQVTKPKSKKPFTPQAIVTINDIEEKKDKNGNKFLLLENNDLSNNVFVFTYKVDESR
jgi:hypothetical protein